MTIKTWNTTYTIEDKGDGAFLVSGHPKYCPEPRLVRLVEEPKIGLRMVFIVPNDRIITTPVVSINP